MKINSKATVKSSVYTPKVVTTHGGGVATDTTTYFELRRSVMSCLLWEDTFYESGISIADRISKLAEQVHPTQLAALAIEARTKYNLRHVPLLLLSILSKTGSGSNLVSGTIMKVISRADELAEFLAVHAKVNKVPMDKIKKVISSQMKKGLANAFHKFDEYQFAKYNKDSQIKLRDVMFLCHPKPKNSDQQQLFHRIANNELKTADTWEVALSGGADKKETFTRLIKENNLGYMALLRNLRNMEQAGVDRDLIRGAIKARYGAHKVLPYRFIAAAKQVPTFEPELDEAMQAIVDESTKLNGKTIIIVDISGSMAATMSDKSEMSRQDAANALAILLRGACNDVMVYATAGNDGRRVHATGLVPARKGMALASAITAMNRTLGGGGIFLNQVMDYVYKQEKNAHRIIVITDEQDCSAGANDAPSKANAFGTINYMINLNGYKHGISYNEKWTHIDGMSGHIVNFIHEFEELMGI